MAGESWAPTLAGVGQHVPTRTRDSATPGIDKMLGTFTATTTPNDAQAQAVIDDAVSWVLAQVGELPQVPPASEQIQQAARSAAEWRASADIEFAYPNRDADIRLAVLLDTRAKDAILALRQALAVEVGGPVDLLPIWQAPGPAPWGDQSPGSGANYLPGISGEEIGTEFF